MLFGPEASLTVASIATGEHRTVRWDPPEIHFPFEQALSLRDRTLMVVQVSAEGWLRAALLGMDGEDTGVHYERMSMLVATTSTLSIGQTEISEHPFQGLEEQPTAPGVGLAGELGGSLGAGAELSGGGEDTRREGGGLVVLAEPMQRDPAPAGCSAGAGAGAAWGGLAALLLLLGRREQAPAHSP